MKNLFLILFALVLTTSASYASFPVKRTVVETETLENNEVSKKELIEAAPATTARKDKWVAAALWFVLGWPFAAHRWYLGSPWYWNVLFIITFAGLAVWAVVDIIQILTDTY